MRPNPTALLLLLAALATPAAAQERHHRREAPPRFYAGADLLFAQPVGSFADQVDKGFGGGAHLIFRPDGTDLVGLRLDGDFVQYGHESRPVPLSNTVGGRINVDLVTDNYIAMLGFGPQIGLPRGRVQPYANGMIGVAYFATQSSLHGDRGGDSFGTTENYHDAAFTWGGGAGVYVPIVRGRVPVSLDFSARYHHNGQVSYLKEGGIRDNPDGTITLDPILGEADLFTFRIGATVGLRSRHCRGRRCGR